MINNFDYFIERYEARRRRTMIRFSLLAGVLFFVLTAIFGYLVWSSTPAVTKTINVKFTQEKVLTPIAFSESNISFIPLVKKEETKVFIQKLNLPNKNISTIKIPIPTGNQTYSIQLGSNKLIENAITLSKKVPEKYRSGIATYFSNGYYATRYINIVDSASIPIVMNDFKKAGFRNLLLMKYNATIIPITTNNTNQAIDSLSTIIPQQSKVSKSHLFDVDTQQINSDTDQLATYEKSPKYETALNIARNFYSKNNFSEASVWAKKANQINREGEEAWLLYAKSYYAQGQKSEAIGVLELYMNYKDSKNATQLYNTWKTTH